MERFSIVIGLVVIVVCVRLLLGIVRRIEAGSQYEGGGWLKSMRRSAFLIMAIAAIHYYSSFLYTGIENPTVITHSALMAAAALLTVFATMGSFFRVPAYLVSLASLLTWLYNLIMRFRSFMSALESVSDAEASSVSVIFFNPNTAVLAVSIVILWFLCRRIRHSLRISSTEWNNYTSTGELTPGRKAAARIFGLIGIAVGALYLYLVHLDLGKTPEVYWTLLTHPSYASRSGIAYSVYRVGNFRGYANVMITSAILILAAFTLFTSAKNRNKAKGAGALAWLAVAAQIGEGIAATQLIYIFTYHFNFFSAVDTWLFKSGGEIAMVALPMVLALVLIFVGGKCAKGAAVAAASSAVKTAADAAKKGTTGTGSSTGTGGILRAGIREEEARKKAEEEAKKAAAEAEKRALEEAAKQAALAKQRQLQEEAAKKAAEEEAKKQAERAAAIKAAEEASRRAQDASRRARAEAERQAAEEAAKKAAVEEAKKRVKADLAAMKAAEEEEKKRAEAEKKRAIAEAEAEKKRAEAEMAQMLAAQARKKAEEEAKKPAWMSDPTRDYLHYSTISPLPKDLA